MSRRLLVPGVVVAVVAAGVLALVLVAAGNEQHIAYPLGFGDEGVSAQIAPGAHACQQGAAHVPTSADGVRLTLGQPGSTPPVRVTVFGADRRVLGRGDIRGGYPPGTRQVARVGALPVGQDLLVCVENLGSAPAVVMGEGPNMDVAYMRTRPRSTLDLLGTAFDRASLFRPEWIGAWPFWVLAGALVLVAPLLLARALARAEREDLAGDDLDPVGPPRA
ncbi:MAG TPA: hypothetical protein VF752_15295 [Thermoleophilaceae bacterium]